MENTNSANTNSANIDESKVNRHYKEVRVLRSSQEKKGDNLIVSFEVLNTVRERVLINDSEAAVLNNGVIRDNNNLYFSYYLKKGENKIPNLTIPLK